MAVSKIGAEFRVNSIGFQSQKSSDVAALTDGGFVAVWDDDSERDLNDASDMSGRDVRVRTFSSDGIAGGAEFRVNDAVTDDQENPGVSALPGGGFAVTFEDESAPEPDKTNILVRAFDSTDAPVTDDLSLNDEDDEFGVTEPVSTVLADGSLAVVYGIFDDSVGVRLSLPGGETGGLFALFDEFPGTNDNSQLFVPHAVAALPGGGFVHAYGGDRVEIVENGDNTSDRFVLLEGVIAWVRTPPGFGEDFGDMEPFQVNQDSEFLQTAPAVTTLADGRFVVSWIGYDGPVSGGGTADVYARIFAGDGTALGGQFLVNGVVAGSQTQVDIAALNDGGFVVTWRDDSGTGGDASGTSIKARVFDADGGAAEGEFLVNTQTTGAQSDPHVATLTDGRFVISWTDEGGEGGADVKAQIFALGAALPDCPVLSRPGTEDGSPSAGQSLMGIAGANSFYFASSSGNDRILNFEKVDVLATDAALRDGNGDGIITFGRNGVLDLGGSDTVAIDGLNGARGLRSLGESCEGVFVYADASVRPMTALEGLLGDDTLSGDTGDMTAQLFFFDTALGLDLGADRITGFGMRDLLVTTRALADSNGDGVIGFGGDRTLDLTGGGSIVINDRSVSSIEYDGSVVRGGVEYFVYSRVGSAGTGVDDLMFG